MAVKYKDVREYRLCVCWVGGNDLKASAKSEPGPILSTLKTISFDKIELLYSYPPEDVEPYLSWLCEQIDVPIEAHYELLSSPIDFGEIYQTANKHLKRLTTEKDAQLSILLSPGTPAMQAVWILLGKTRYPSLFYQSSLCKFVCCGYYKREPSPQWVRTKSTKLMCA